MRKMMMALAPVMALSLGAPAFADAPANPEGDKAAVTQGTKKRVGKRRGRLGRWFKRMVSRWKKMKARLFKKLGPAAAQVRKFWQENIKPKIKAGKGRLWRSMIGFLRKARRFNARGKLSQFLERATKFWSGKPVVGAPPAAAPAAPPK